MMPCGLATSSSQRRPSWLPKPRLSRVFTVVSGSKIRITIFSPKAVGSVDKRISTSSPAGFLTLMRPLDGRIKVRNPAGDEVEMRLSTLPTAFGEKMVMRIFDPDTTVKDLDALGFSAHDAQRWEALVKRPTGIILVTGPTGSGKTTTLYSTLKRVATEEVNVSTVEDPIEMIEPLFNQTQVQPQLDFGCL